MCKPKTSFWRSRCSSRSRATLTWMKRDSKEKGTAQPRPEVKWSECFNQIAHKQPPSWFCLGFLQRSGMVRDSCSHHCYGTTLIARSFAGGACGLPLLRHKWLVLSNGTGKNKRPPGRRCTNGSLAFVGKSWVLMFGVWCFTWVEWMCSFPKCQKLQTIGQAEVNIKTPCLEKKLVLVRYPYMSPETKLERAWMTPLRSSGCIFLKGGDWLNTQIKRPALCKTHAGLRSCWNIAGKLHIGCHRGSVPKFILRQQLIMGFGSCPSQKLAIKQTTNTWKLP